MTPEGLRTFCLSLPHVEEDIKWEDHLCFMIAKKMFAVTNLAASKTHFVAVKCTPQKAAELLEIDGIIPTPYMERNHWVTLQRGDVLRDGEIKELVQTSYAVVVSKLPKRTQAALLSETKGGLKKKPAKKKHRSSSR